MGSDFMGDMIGQWARCQNGVGLAPIMAGAMTASGSPAQAIMDECARQAGELIAQGRQEPEVEKRLRRLVAVMLELKSLGLVD